MSRKFGALAANSRKHIHMELPWADAAKGGRVWQRYGLERPGTVRGLAVVQEDGVAMAQLPPAVLRPENTL